MTIVHTNNRFLIILTSSSVWTSVYLTYKQMPNKKKSILELWKFFEKFKNYEKKIIKVIRFKGKKEHILSCFLANDLTDPKKIENSCMSSFLFEEKN